MAANSDGANFIARDGFLGQQATCATLLPQDPKLFPEGYSHKICQVAVSFTKVMCMILVTERQWIQDYKYMYNIDRTLAYAPIGQNP